MHVNAQSGAATFQANVQSSYTAQQIKVQFHYIDSGTANCADPAQNSPPNGTAQCGASWSGSPTVTPGTIPPPARTPEGAPVLLVLAGAGTLGAVVRMRRRATRTLRAQR